MLLVVAGILGMLLLWAIVILTVVWMVFVAFNFVPWNGFRNRPRAASGFRERAAGKSRGVDAQ